MYLNSKYRRSDPEWIFTFIQQHPFATIVLSGERLLATHIPVLTEGEPGAFTLFGHIAKNNAMFPSFEDDKEVLLIFHGADGYVSSSWYKEKNISTWDYAAVHVNGTLQLQTQTELEASLIKLVKHFEKDQEQPLYYNDIPREIIDEHLPGIRGFWCNPVKIEAVAKLHQGFARHDITSIIEHLQKQEKPCMSELIKLISNEHDN